MRPQMNADQRRYNRGEDFPGIPLLQILNSATTAPGFIRVYLRLSAVALISTLVAPAAALQSADGTDTLASGHAVVRPVELDEVRWTDGFWADRFATVRDRSLPAMWEIMRGTKYKPYLQHFLIAAGEAEGDYHGAQWNDGDFY